eukprot:c5698_g1_i1 orf=57-1427(+)
MAKYWASCSPGLEFALIAELQNLEHTQIIQDASIFGGVAFSTLSAATDVLKLRSADNVYAFVGKFQDLPFERNAAVLYLKELAEKVDWDSPLDLFWRWKTHKAADSNAAFKDDKSQALSFRVSCDRACVMMKKHGFTSMEAAAALGEGVYERFGWPADMCFYDLEVLAWIRDDEILLALALLQRRSKTLLLDREEVMEIKNSDVKAHVESFQSCSQELNKDNKPEHYAEKMRRPIERSSRAKHAESQLYAWRIYRKALVDTSLKPSVAHALLQLGCILPGSVILDPMCGCATIPLEAAESFGNQVYCMAGDISTRAVDATSENVKASGAVIDCEILQWNASNLPLRNGVVDRIVCDMPFGIRCGTSKSRDSLCPKVLREIVRVLHLGSGMAVLLGQSKAVRHEVEKNLKPFLELLQSLSIQMEGLRVEILVVQRTEEPYQAPQRKVHFSKGKYSKQ